MWAVAPTGLDARALSDALGARADPELARRLRDACGDDPRLSWERGLFEASISADDAIRRAMVSEQILDLDGRIQRWARVPRVAASVSTSTGFLLASLALIGSLGAAPAGETSPAGLSTADLASAVAALAVGVAGASFCIAVHVGSSRAVAQRLAAIDRLTAHLETLAEARGPRPAVS